MYITNTLTLYTFTPILNISLVLTKNTYATFTQR